MLAPMKLLRALAPKLAAGGMYAATAAAALAGAPIAPCSPDGVCLPRYETWGWYETRWRPFPGDPVGGVPTQAPTAPTDPQENLTGPQRPGAGQEGQVGPEKREITGGVAPAPTLPGGGAGAGGAGAVVPPGGTVPPAGGAPQTQPGAEEEPTPDALPDVIDPFGAAPPTPPAWMVESASYVPLPGAEAPQQFEQQSPLDPATVIQSAPNMQGDDAPPALPAGLHDLFGAAANTPAWTTASAAPVALVQPARLHAAACPTTNRGVVQASAQAPLGIQLINPASAIAAEANAEGAQQAIYFEASDLPTAEATPAH